MARRAHDGCSGGTTSPITGARREHLAFAFCFKLNPDSDKLAQVRIRLVVATTDGLIDLTAAETDPLAGAAFWSLWSARRASVVAEFAVAALASVGDSTARFTAPVMLHGDALNVRLTGVAVGVAIAAADRTVVTGAVIVRNRFALTAHIGSAAHVRDRE